MARVARHRPDRHDGEDEDDRQRRQQDAEGDLVRRLLPFGALDERDHAVDERLTGLARDLDDDAVRQHRRTAGDGAAIAARFADDGRRLTGDGRLVDRRDTVDDVAVTGDDLAGLDDDAVADAQFGAGHALLTAVRHEAAGDGVDAGLTQGVGLRLAAPFSDGLGEVGEQDRQPQPDRDGDREHRRVDDRQHRREHRAHPDDEDDGGAHEVARVELAQGVRRRFEGRKGE